MKFSQKPLVAVMAGNKTQFDDWANKNPDLHGIFCDDWPRFAGMEFEKAVEIGTFRARKDALGIWQKVMPMVRPKVT